MGSIPYPATSHLICSQNLGDRAYSTFLRPKAFLNLRSVIAKVVRRVGMGCRTAFNESNGSSL